MKHHMLAVILFCAACSGQVNENKEATTETLTREQYISSIDRNDSTLTNSTSMDSIIFLANRQVKLCEDFVAKYPKDERVPRYLNFAAKASRAAGRPEKAVEFYNRIISGHYDFENMPEVMFMKAFVYDEDLKQKDKARDAYTELISKFPGHRFSEDARMLLTQLYMTDEELLRTLEKKNAD